jgi:hypothetical protein
VIESDRELRNVGQGCLGGAYGGLLLGVLETESLETVSAGNKSGSTTESGARLAAKPEENV